MAGAQNGNGDPSVIEIVPYRACEPGRQLRRRWHRSEFEMKDLPAQSANSEPDDRNAESVGADELCRLAQFSLDQAADPIFWIDSNARFIYANQAACLALEYSSDEMRALTVHDIDPLFLKGQWPSHWKEIRQRRSFVFESIHRTKSGKTYPVEIAVNCLTLCGKEYNCVFARNIAERKAAEERLRRFAAIVNSSHDAILGLTCDGIITSWNAAAERLFGYTAEEAIGTSISILWPADKVAEGQALLGEASADHMVDQFETIRRRKDGSPVNVAITLSACKDDSGRLVGASAIVRDITPRKQAEEQLTKTQQAAEAANRAKSEFLANMSHEIRTPMTAILGFADILANTVVDREAVEVAHIIKRNGEHLLTIINDILDLSRIESGKDRIEELVCSPHQIVADVVRTMKVSADAKGLFLRSESVGDVPDSIRTDPIRLRQILVNLVGNAVKFTEVGGVRIITQVDADTNGEPRLRFDVADTGIGLSNENIGRIFQPFSQADSSTKRRFGGTGLGLAISQRLARMLGGDIVVSSSLGKGSIFSLTIAMRLSHGERQLGQSSTTADVRSHEPSIAITLSGHILLAEDGPDNQRLIRHVLQKAGLEVTVADNGQLAVELALAAQSSGCPFNAILMDIQMPVMDGYEATRHLRGAGYTGPIVALTAHAMMDDRQKCLDVGCDSYVTKPIDRADLLRVMANYVDRQPDSRPVEATIS